MPKRKTHEQFIEELRKVDETIIVLGNYKNAATPVLCKCKRCGYEWPGIPNNLLRGEGCMDCAGHLKKTTERFIEEMAEVDPGIEILGEYVNTHTKIAWRCKVCGYKNSSGVWWQDRCKWKASNGFAVRCCICWQNCCRACH